MSMSRLNLRDIRKMLADAPAPPLSEPTDESSEIFTCPVCLLYRHDMMIAHENCGVLICASCVLVLLDNNRSCPMCRELTHEPWSWEPTSTNTRPIRFRKPTRVENHFMSLIEYRCENCDQLNKFEAAKLHHLNCPGAPSRHQPPPHIAPRGQSKLERVELISNVSSQADKSDFGKRTFIVHLNGRQLVSKSFGLAKNCNKLRCEIARDSGHEPNEIKIYKFEHRELDDSTQLNEIAARVGATYITAFTRIPELSERTANLILEEVGVPHYIPPREADLDNEIPW